MPKYRILITRSCVGNFSWSIRNAHNRILAESGMLTRFVSCKNAVTPIARALGAEIEYFDLEKDYVE